MLSPALRRARMRSDILFSYGPPDQAVHTFLGRQPSLRSQHMSSEWNPRGGPVSRNAALTRVAFSALAAAHQAIFVDIQKSMSGFPALVHRIVEGGSVLKA